MGFQMRHCRPSECRQIDIVQRPHPDGGRRRRRTILLPPSNRMSVTSSPRSPSRPAGGDWQERPDPSRTRLTFVDIAGLVRGASKARARNQFLANIRGVDCHRPRGALLRGWRCQPMSKAVSIRSRYRDDRDRIDGWADLEQPGESERALWRSACAAPTRKPRSSSTSSSVRWCCCAKAGPLASSNASRKRKRPSACWASSARSRCFMSAMSRKPRPTKGNQYSAKVIERAKEEEARRWWSRPRSKAEIAVLPATEQNDYLDTIGSPSRASIVVIPPLGYELLHSRDIFHPSVQGSPRLDRHQGHQGTAGGRRHPYRFRERLHPLPETIAYDDYVGLNWRGLGRAMPASSGLKARITLCKTGTSCISASPT